MSGPPSPRPWQEIAAEAAIELDSEKLLRLTEELARALDADEQKLRSQTHEQTLRKAA